MDIGEAIKKMRAGAHVARKGWNGNGMWLRFVPATKGFLAYVIMRTVDGFFVPWLCSQTDLLAHDWEVVGKD